MTMITHPSILMLYRMTALREAPLPPLIEPGVHKAVDQAAHDVDADRFHRRITGACPFCLTIGEKLARAFRENVPGTDIARQARERMLAIMDAQDAAASV